MTKEQIISAFNKEKQNENKEMLIILICSILFLFISIPFAKQILKEEEIPDKYSSVIGSFCKFYKALSPEEKGSLAQKLKNKDSFCESVVKLEPIMSGFIGGYPRPNISFLSLVKIFFIMIPLTFIMTFLLFFLDNDNNKNILIRSLPKNTDLWLYDWISGLKKDGKLNSLADFNQWMTMPERYSEEQLTLMKMVFNQETLKQKFINILNSYKK